MFTFVRFLSTKEVLIFVVLGLPLLAVLVAALARKRVRPWIPFVVCFALATLYFATLSGYSRGKWMFLGEELCRYILPGLILLGLAAAIGLGAASAFSTRLRVLPGRVLPRRLATVGLVLYLAFIFAIVFLADFPNWGNRAPAAACLNNVRQVGLACLQYFHDHGDRSPESFGALLKEGYLNSAKVFFCPSKFSRLPGDFPADYQSAPPGALRVIDEASDYVLVKGVRPGEPDGRILIYEKDAVHGKKARVVFFADGHIKLVEEAAFRELMAKRANAASSLADRVTLIEGSCEGGRELGDLSSYGVRLRAKPDSLGFIRVRREAVWTLEDLSNVLGTVPCGTILWGEGPLKNAEYSMGVGYAVAVRDSQCRQCRGYVSYTVVEVLVRGESAGIWQERR